MDVVSRGRERNNDRACERTLWKGEVPLLSSVSARSTSATGRQHVDGHILKGEDRPSFMMYAAEAMASSTVDR